MKIISTQVIYINKSGRVSSDIFEQWSFRLVSISMQSVQSLIDAVKLVHASGEQ